MDYFSLTKIFLIIHLYLINSGECGRLISGNLTDKTSYKYGSEPITVCYSDSECTSKNRLCVDNRCKCEPGTKWDYSTDTCISFVCDGDYSCQSYDSNRYCNKNGHCLCKNNYDADYSNGQKCVQVTSDTCSSDSQCTFKDANKLCVDGSCHCAPNYEWSEHDQKCQFHTCKSILDCNKDWDNMRDCKHGRCLCWNDDYTEDTSNGRKCIFTWTVWNWSWGWAVIVVPIVFVAALTYSVIKYRQRHLSHGVVMAYRY